MLDLTQLLYLPFDECKGTVAQDYSPYRMDATLSKGATFTTDAKIGGAVDLCGGEAYTKQGIDFAADFTLSFHLKVSTDKLNFIINLEDESDIPSIEEVFVVIPEQWHYIAIVKAGYKIKLYLDSYLIFSTPLEVGVVGIALNTEEEETTTAKLDEVKLYNVAKTKNEIMKMQSYSPDVEYYVDGINFKDYGVYVSASTGLLGRLAQKEALSVDYDNYHGIARSRKVTRYKERTIQLQCFIEAPSRRAFVEKLYEFLDLFNGNQTHRLKVEYDGPAKPLVYEVDMIDNISIDKKWGSYSTDTMIGTFTLKLMEYEPVKKVLRYVAKDDKTVTITVTSSLYLNIYWGDGSRTFNVAGNNRTITHTYSENDEFDIVITGVIENITKFETNAIVVWQLLK